MGGLKLVVGSRRLTLTLGINKLVIERAEESKAKQSVNMDKDIMKRDGITREVSGKPVKKRGVCGLGLVGITDNRYPLHSFYIWIRQ